MLFAASITQPSLAFGQEPVPDPNATPPAAIDVTGRERIGWDQLAPTAADLELLEFVFFVDEAPINARSVICDLEPGADGFQCSSALPTMSVGRHELRMSVRQADSEGVESPRSDAIFLNVQQSNTRRNTGSAGDDRIFVAADGLRFKASIISSELVDATGLALVGKGRIAISERAGRIRVFERDGRSSDAVQSIPELDSSADGAGLLAIAAGGKFEPAGVVFIVYNTRTGARLARYLADDYGLTARATLMDGLPLSRSGTRVSLSVGPDQKLYVGLDDGQEPSRVQDRGALNGKVLRLNLDGSTPSDVARSTYTIGVNHPTAMSWSINPPILWLAGADASDTGQLVQLMLSDDAVSDRRFSLPSSMGDLAIATFTSDKHPTLNGNLLIAGSEQSAMLRAKISQAGEIQDSEWLFEDLLQGVRAILIDPSGVIYACSSTRLIRIELQN